MPLGRVYRRGNEGVIASCDFIDIASGTGIINFYPGKAGDSYIQSNLMFYSDPIATTAAIDSSEVSKLYIDLDFDVMISKPLVIYGKSVANVTLGLCNNGGSNAAHGYVIVKVRKWDGASETEIASGTGTSWTWAGGVLGYSYHREACYLDIPLTHFKKGEYLRVTIMAYADNSNSVHNATGAVSVGHDPMDRTITAGLSGAGEALGNKAIIQIPVRIDL